MNKAVIKIEVEFSRTTDGVITNATGYPEISGYGKTKTESKAHFKKMFRGNFRHIGLGDIALIEVNRVENFVHSVKISKEELTMFLTAACIRLQKAMDEENFKRQLAGVVKDFLSSFGEQP